VTDSPASEASRQGPDHARDRQEPAFALRTMAGNLRVNSERRVVDQTLKSWNPLLGWLRDVDCLRAARSGGKCSPCKGLETGERGSFLQGRL
jgi:hypothetical protein